MIKVIAHRANLRGISNSENSPSAINEAIKLGFDVEIDIWVVNNKIYLGHDEPTYDTNLEFLLSRHEKLWIHCKNLEAISFLLGYKNLNIFWHQTDDFVITRSNHIWTYPNKKLTKSSIAVMPHDLGDVIKQDPYAVCTDDAINALSLIENII